MKTKKKLKSVKKAIASLEQTTLKVQTNLRAGQTYPSVEYDFVPN